MHPCIILLVFTPLSIILLVFTPYIRINPWLWNGSCLYLYSGTGWRVIGIGIVWVKWRPSRVRRFRRTGQRSSRWGLLKVTKCCYCMLWHVVVCYCMLWHVVVCWPESSLWLGIGYGVEEVASDSEVDFEDDDEYRKRRAEHDKKKRQAEKVGLPFPKVRQWSLVDVRCPMSEDTLNSVLLFRVFTSFFWCNAAIMFSGLWGAIGGVVSSSEWPR